jgi:hypothetical protein
MEQTLEKRTIIAVDFDGTLCENQWPKIGAPNTKLIEGLIRCKNQGDKLILWTNRVGDELNDAVKWCKEQGLEFDAINDNLPEIVDSFGSNCRKIFANVYIDDRALNPEHTNTLFEESRLERWAKREVELACERERKSSPDDNKSKTWDYGCECYKSALKAFQSLCGDDHSGMSISITKSILNRLIDGKPLTPIEESDGIWNDVSEFTGDKPGSRFQCNRMSSLFKEIKDDGSVKYTDVNRYFCQDENSKATYRNGLVSELLDELEPITMPYAPANMPFAIFCEDFLYSPDGGDWDTIGILRMRRPDGIIVDINRYYKENPSGKGMIEISKEEYMDRKANPIK